MKEFETNRHYRIITETQFELKRFEAYKNVDENIFEQQELKILKDKVLDLAVTKTLSLVDITEEIIAMSNIGGQFRSFNFRSWEWKKGSKSWKKEPNLKNPGFQYDDAMMPHFVHVTICHNYAELKRRLGATQVSIRTIKHNPRFDIIKSEENYYYVKLTSYTDPVIVRPGVQHYCRVERSFFLCDDLWGIIKLMNDTIV